MSIEITEADLRGKPLQEAMERVRESGDRDTLIVLAAYTELNSAICWDTTCLNCSKLLDGSYAETVRAEVAEEKLRRVEALRDEYRRDDEWSLVNFGQHHPVAGVAADHLDAALAGA